MLNNDCGGGVRDFVLSRSNIFCLFVLCILGCSSLLPSIQLVYCYNIVGIEISELGLYFGNQSETKFTYNHLTFQIMFPIMIRLIPWL
jgi:hypothetical protein